MNRPFLNLPLVSLRRILPTFILLSFLSLALISCEKDDDPDNPDEPIPTCVDGEQNGDETGIDCGGACDPCTTSVVEDKANIQKTFDDMVGCMQNISDSRGIDVFFREFLKISDGTTQNQDWIDDLSADLENVVDVDHIEQNNRIDFAHHVGIYAYDITNKTWSRASAMNQIVFQFPSDEEKTTNNSSLSINKYSDTEVTINEDNVSLPTEMNLVLEVDAERIFEFDIKNIVYDDNADFEIPITWDISMFIAPVTISTTLVKNTSTDYQLTFGFNDDDKCNIGIELDIELLDDDIENLSTESFKKIEAKVIIGQMTIQSLAGLAELIAIDDPSDEQVNSLLNLEALFDNVKIADMEFQNNMESLILYYKDSSSEDINTYWDPFIEDIEAITDEFFGE